MDGLSYEGVLYRIALRIHNGLDQEALVCIYPCDNGGQCLDEFCRLIYLETGHPRSVGLSLLPLVLGLLHIVPC